jgi:nicotinic acid mononucleotide adenylyltransferase
MDKFAHLGRIIGEEIALDPGLCLYPGKFKPPHKGHWAVAKDLASRNYITELSILISPRTVEGITSEISHEIWDIYLKCEPNSKIRIYKAATDSPVKDAYKFIEKNSDVKKFYIAGGADEAANQSYFQSFQKKFDDKVFVIGVEEKFDRVSATYVRKTLKDKDFERFKNTLPDAVVSKGYAKDIYEKLIKVYTPENINEKFDSNISDDPMNAFVMDCCELLEIESKPQIIFLDNPLPGNQPSFGAYDPSNNSIYVCCGKRHIMDILRTLAHELVHCKQLEMGQLTSNEDGRTGSEIENEANAVAGMIMRRYAKRNPHLFV